MFLIHKHVFSIYNRQEVKYEGLIRQNPEDKSNNDRSDFAH